MSSSFSVYIHIPFCSTKCTYCAFNTYVKLEALIAPFVDALVREVAFLGESKPGQTVGTIYFGGGTPSLLQPEQFAEILGSLFEHFQIRTNAEISLETNPNDLDAAYLSALRQIGINRLSIGMQSANERELRLFHRRHDFDMVVRGMEAARAAGFDNLNLDLIYGVPEQTLATWEKSLHRAIDLGPEHLSLYALGLEDGTPMQRWVASGDLPSPDDDLAADMYDLASDMLGQVGYSQYEISNWARPGYACRHNLQYWRNLPYVGLGPGAHGYAAGLRYSTVLLPESYIQVISDPAEHYKFPLTPAVAEATVIDRESEIAETLITGLRLIPDGIERADFRARFGVDLLDLHGPVVEKYTSLGLLAADAQGVRLTARGRLLSNAIFRELI